MAGAFSAMSGDVTGLEYNPAALQGIERADINLNYVKYFEDISLQSASIAYPFQLNDRSLSGEFVPLSQRRSIIVGVHYRQLQADDYARSDLGAKLDKISLKDQLIQGVISYDFSKQLSAGIAGKIINRKIYTKSISQFATDLGVLYKLNPTLDIAAAILNYGSDKAFISDPDPLPTLARVGAAFKYSKINLSADVSTGKDKITQPALGAEYNLNPYVAFRAGVKHHTDVEFSGGLGLRFSNPIQQLSEPVRERKSNRKILDELDVPQQNQLYQKNSEQQKPLDFGLDYAITTHNDLDVSHNITVKILY